MADKAHQQTDKILAEMEAHLSAIYAHAQMEIEEKAAEYFAQFEKLDAQKRKLVDVGKLSEEEYKKWRRNKLMYGKHWTKLKQQLAEKYAKVNRTALSYINGKLPEVYALNYNDFGEAAETALKGYSFELVNAHTVKNLATSDQTLLPYKYLNGIKDVRWNTQKVNAAILQGILQGESIPNLAKRLRSVTDMNKVSAIRNARTTVTSAENKGRQDSYEKATQDGIKLKREWIAAIDGRTRHAHRLLDGQLADVDKPFKSELGPIMFPGDPSADPANVYNCRCTIAAKVISIGGVKIDREESLQSEPKRDIIKSKYQHPITINDCSSETIMFDFEDGTPNGIRKTSNATVYKTPDEIEFIFSTGYNKKHQTMTPEKAIELYYRVPEKIREMGQKRIIFNDIYNPQDNYWRKKYKKFPHSYATGGDTINFWRYDKTHDDNYVVRTFCHEIAHKIDIDNGTKGDSFSNGTWWIDAIAEDEKISGKASVTKYGENATSEDFAESIAEYVTNPDEFKKEFPNRSMILGFLLQ